MLAIVDLLLLAILPFIGGRRIIRILNPYFLKLMFKIRTIKTTRTNPRRNKHKNNNPKMLKNLKLPNIHKISN